MANKAYLVRASWAVLIAAAVGVPTYLLGHRLNTDFKARCEAVGGTVTDVGRGEQHCVKDGLTVE